MLQFENAKRAPPQPASICSSKSTPNPFGEFDESDWVAAAVVDVSAIVKKLQSPKYAVQFVGEKGYGKTTHLLAIKSQFDGAGYVHIAEGTRARLPTGDPVMIDEAQRLTFLQRCRLFRRNVPLVLGTHRDFQSELRLAKRSVETVHVEQGTSVERLHRLLNERIKMVQRNPGAIPEITEQTASDLLGRHGPNIRAVLHELFEEMQKQTQITKL